MNEKYQLLKNLGYERIHFIVNCSPQQMLKELMDPTIFDNPNLDYYVSERTELTQTLKGKLPNGDILEFKNGELLCNKKKLCNDCFLSGKVTQSQYCRNHKKVKMESKTPKTNIVVLNDFVVVESTIKIPLYNRDHEIVVYALADKEDEEKLSLIAWSIQTKGYVGGIIRTNETEPVHVLIHRYILNTIEGILIDHINNNRLDNRKLNLREVTPSENNHSRTKKPNCTSQYYGVSYNDRHKKPWTAYCMRNLGDFHCEEWAAYCHDQEAIKIFKDKARLNNIPKPDGYIPWEPRKTAENVEINGVKAKGLTFFPNKQKPYRILLTINEKVYTKTFKNIEEAKTEYLKLKVLQNIPKPPPKIPRNSNGIAILPCLNTSGVLVDDDTFLKYYSISCYLSATSYPGLRFNGKQRLLHSLVIHAKPGELVDHIDRNPLNAQLSNLRIVPSSVNAHNRTKSKNSGAKFMGVYKHKDKYMTKIVKDGIPYHGGMYKDENVAAWCADQLSKQLYREFARSNNIKLNGYLFINNRALRIKKSNLESFETNSGYQTQITKRQKN
jgi:hypothetical protein